MYLLIFLSNYVEHNRRKIYKIFLLPSRFSILSNLLACLWKTVMGGWELRFWNHIAWFHISVPPLTRQGDLDQLTLSLFFSKIRIILLLHRLWVLNSIFKMFRRLHDIQSVLSEWIWLVSKCTLYTERPHT